MKLLSVLLSWAVIGYGAYFLGTNRSMSVEERQNIAIDYMSHGTWRYTLCNDNNYFSPMDADKETKK